MSDTPKLANPARAWPGLLIPSGQRKLAEQRGRALTWGNITADRYLRRSEVVEWPA